MIAAVFSCGLLAAAGPVLTELQPRGAQKGKSITLTLGGRNLGAGARIITNLPAVLTPLTAGPKGLPFLLELKPDVPSGTYPVRVETADGISNILLFTVGDFPRLRKRKSPLMQTIRSQRRRW